MTRVGAVVLAAGRSARFRAAGGSGATKLVEKLGGKPIVRMAAEAALASRARPVIVVTGHARASVEAALAGLDVECAHNPEFSSGLASSLRVGLAAMPADVAGALVLLGDMPWIEARLIDALIDAFLAKEARARRCAHARRPARQPRAARARPVRGGDALARRRGRAPADRLARRRRTRRSRSARRRAWSSISTRQATLRRPGGCEATAVDARNEIQADAQQKSKSGATKTKAGRNKNKAAFRSPPRLSNGLCQRLMPPLRGATTAQSRYQDASTWIASLARNDGPAHQRQSPLGGGREPRSCGPPKSRAGASGRTADDRAQ